MDPWQKARDKYEAGSVFEGTVRGVNRGGVLVDCWGVSGAPLLGNTKECIFQLATPADHFKYSISYSDSARRAIGCIRPLHVDS